MRFPATSVVVPVYGSEATLRELHDRLRGTLEKSCKDYEIVFVEDGGPDDSWSVVEEIAAEDPRVLGIRLSRNFGQHNALLCGTRAARHGVVVTLDDDLQHPPEEIPKLLAALTTEVDVVYGRPEKLPHSRTRNLASTASKQILSRATKVESVLYISAFRAFRSDLREAFADHESPSLSLDALLSWGTDRFSAVIVSHEARRDGESNYTFLKLVKQAWLVLRGFSKAPQMMQPKTKQSSYEVSERVGGHRMAKLEGQSDVTLRSLTAGDAPSIYAWMLDPTVSENIGLTRSPSLEYTHAFIERSTRGGDLRAFGILLVGEHVGNVVLDRIDSTAGSARMSIYLGEHSARNRGVGSAALREILEVGFDELELDEIWLTVLVGNQPARRIYEAAGFEMAPEREHQVAPNDVPKGSLLMTLSRSNFLREVEGAKGAS